MRLNPIGIQDGVQIVVQALRVGVYYMVLIGYTTILEAIHRIGLKRGGMLNVI